MVVKPGYKQTEVGVIPEDWDDVSLGDKTTKVGSGITPTGGSKVYKQEGRPFLRSQNVGWGTLLMEDIAFIDDATHETFKATEIESDDVFLNITGASIGRSAIADARVKGGNVNQHVCIIRTNQERLHPRFLNYFLLSKAGQRQIDSFQAGGNRQGLNFGQIRSFRLPLPPTVDEQRAIARALGDVDALLGALEQLIAKKRDLKQAAMQQLLNGQTRLKGFGPTRAFKRFDYGKIPEDWDIKPFRKVSTMSGRIGWQGLKQDEFTENPDDPFLITGMNFKDGIIRWDEVYHIPVKRYQEAPPIQLKVDDVLITKDGTIGKLLFVDFIPHPGMASLNSHLLVFRPIDQQYVPKFLFYQLSSPTFAQHIELYKSGSTFFGLTQSATGKYPVVLPSIPEQIAIARVLSDMDAELAALEARLAKTRAIKQGMMQDLLTGRTRLF